MLFGTGYHILLANIIGKIKELKTKNILFNMLYQRLIRGEGKICSVWWCQALSDSTVNATSLLTTSSSQKSTKYRLKSLRVIVSLVYQLLAEYIVWSVLDLLYHIWSPIPDKIAPIPPAKEKRWNHQGRLLECNVRRSFETKH